MAFTQSQLNEIKKLVETGKIVYGADQALKLLRAGKAAKVWLSKNVDAGSLEDIKRYASIAGVEVVELPQSNEELGELCRKPFSVSVISTAK